jgi:hypothetical protein
VEPQWPNSQLKFYHYRQNDLLIGLSQKVELWLKEVRLMKY